MENRSHALLAGLFVLLLGLALAGAIAWFTGDREEGKTYLLVARGRVNGLNPQAAVRFRGIQVGRVEAIDFDRADPANILIRIGVRKDAPITQSTYAQLGYQGLTGLAHIQLDDEGKDRRPLPTSGRQPARIPVRPSLLEDVASAAQQLTARVGDVAERLSTLLKDENLARIEGTLANLQTASSRLVQLEDSVAPAAQALPGLTRDASGVLKRADGVMTKLDGLTVQLGNSAGSIERVARSAERIGQTGEAVGDQMMNSALPKFMDVLNDLSHTSHNLDRLLGDLQRRPQSLIFGREPPPPGPGEPGFSRRTAQD